VPFGERDEQGGQGGREQHRAGQVDADRVRPERVAGTMREATSRTTRPTGTLTRKMGLQEAPAMPALTSSPPASWPTTGAMPEVAQIGRLSARNTSVRRDRP